MLSRPHTALFSLFISALTLCYCCSSNAISREAIKKQSIPLAEKICARSAKNYYSSLPKKALNAYCKKIIHTSKPSINYCIENTPLLAMKSSAFTSCIIKKLTKNTKFIKSVFYTVVKICEKKTLQRHPDFKKEQLRQICRKAAPTEIKHIIKKLTR